MEIFPEMSPFRTSERGFSKTVTRRVDERRTSHDRAWLRAAITMGEAFIFQSLRWITRAEPRRPASCHGGISARVRATTTYSLKAHFPTYPITPPIIWFRQKLPKGAEFPAYSGGGAERRVRAGEGRSVQVGDGAVSFRILAADAISLRRAKCGLPPRLAYESLRHRRFRIKRNCRSGLPSSASEESKRLDDDALDTSRFCLFQTSLSRRPRGCQA